MLPDIDTQFRELDSRMRLRIEQHRLLVQRRDHMLTTPRPEFLATRGEQEALLQIERTEERLATGDAPNADMLRRLQRLKGVLSWTLETEYYDRLATFDQNLRSLDAEMAVLQEEYDQYVRARQAAMHSYVGYETPISGLRTQVQTSVREIDLLMARQGRLLETMAIDELLARRGLLESFGDKARFALADSYDRATQAQAKADVQ
jgi:chromosome segregation ATPase